jgi:hypothetical protein
MFRIESPAARGKTGIDMEMVEPVALKSNVILEDIEVWRF